MNNSKFLNGLKNILNDNCVEKLRIVDPRVNHYELYVELKKSDIKEILTLFPEAKVEYTFLKKVKSVSQKGKEGFTIYNVSNKRREKLINKHDQEYLKDLEEIKKKGIMF